MNREVLDYLISNSDPKYLEFNDGINPNNEYKMLGVRIPIIRSYAKKLSKEYSLEYLFNSIENDYFECVLLKLILVGSYKNLSFKELENYIKLSLPLITDWALCDSFVVSLKITKKYKNEMWKLINKYLSSKKEFYVRFSLVMILNYYIEEEYLNDIYNIVDNVNLDYYYVKMANAWLISYLFIYDYERTLDYYKRSKLDKWTYNKGITKSIESYRLSSDEKEELRSIKR